MSATCFVLESISGACVTERKKRTADVYVNLTVTLELKISLIFFFDLKMLD